VDPRRFAIAAGVSVAIGFVVHAWAGLGLWESVAVTIAAMIVNGIFAVVEDEGSDGFRDPRPDERSDDAT
jgi:hypothetical protein